MYQVNTLLLAFRYQKCPIEKSDNELPKKMKRKINSLDILDVDSARHIVHVKPMSILLKISWTISIVKNLLIFSRSCSLKFYGLLSSI